MPDPRAEMEELLDAVLPFARGMIEDHGEFHPAAASMDAAGEIGFVAAYTGEEFPPGGHLIALMTSELRDQAEHGTIRASAVFANVTVELPAIGRTDAIQVVIEHRDADPVTVHLPYRKKRLRGREFGDLVAMPGERSIFTAPPP